MSRLGAFALFVCALLASSRALARVERFAVVIGNNRGAQGEIELRYAESDARRMSDVLRELGGVEPANAVLITGASADTVRRSLITVNDRIRRLSSEPNTDVVLFVYYSGHADARALHLGESALDTAELVQLVRGSSATFRLLVVDACRSGELTRKKGGTPVPPFAVEADAALSGEGLAFLTASAADEDAQESDALKSSFFTHAFVSGLLGAADRDGDGAVLLEEAYRYGYDATVRSTSRTVHGTQHPSFQYDFHGQGRLVLTETRLSRAERGALHVGPALETLIFRENPDGAVVAELPAHAPARTLNLAPGRYFLRMRADAHLLEGGVHVGAGRTSEVDIASLTRIEYGRLVRKGGVGRRVTRGLELGAALRRRLPNEGHACAGGVVGLRIERERATLRPHIGLCTSTFENDALTARVLTYDLGLRVGHAWDTRLATLELGAGVSATLFRQHFDARGSAPARATFAGNASAYVLVLRELGRGIYGAVDASAELYVLALHEGRADSLRAAFPARGNLLVGKHF